MHICIHTHISHIHIHIYVCVCVCLYIYIYTHTNTHTHTQHTWQPSHIAWDTHAFWSMSHSIPTSKKCPAFQKSFKIFPHLLHFQFLDDFISRVFINIVFCWYSASNEVFDLHAFLFQIHSSFLKMADSKKQKHLTAYDPSWEKDFPIGPVSQNKHAFYCHPS